MTLAKEAYDLASRWDAARTVEDVSRLSFNASDLAKLDTNQISTHDYPFFPPSSAPS